jgi:hypothetical protein
MKMQVPLPADFLPKMRTPLTSIYWKRRTRNIKAILSSFDLEDQGHWGITPVVWHELILVEVEVCCTNKLWTSLR